MISLLMHRLVAALFLTLVAVPAWADRVQVYGGAGVTWVDADQDEAILFPVFRKRSAHESFWAPYARVGARVFVDRRISVGLEAMGIFAGDIDMIGGKEDGSAWSIAFLTGFGF